MFSRIRLGHAAYVPQDYVAPTPGIGIPYIVAPNASHMRAIPHRPGPAVASHAVPAIYKVGQAVKGPKGGVLRTTPIKNGVTS